MLQNQSGEYPGGINGGVIKALSGLMKIIYPDGNVTYPELEEVLSLSCELREWFRISLPDGTREYERVKISGRILRPCCRDTKTP